MKEIKNNKTEDIISELMNELEKREDFGWCALNVCGLNKS